MDTQNLTIKKCPKCERKFVVDKGFYKNISQSDGYSTYCKDCEKAFRVDTYQKNKEYVLDNHLWTEIDKVEQCKRCGLVRRRTAYTRAKGRWFIEFYVNKRWQPEPVKCVIIK